MEYDKVLKNILGRDDYLIVGKSIARSDSLDKALGKAKFTADYIPRGTMVVKVFRSSLPHALIKKIHTEAASSQQGVIDVITAKDVPGINQIGYAIADQPFLNDRKAHFVGDPIALVCAEDEYSAAAGIDAMEVEYESLKPLFDTRSALRPEAPPIHDGGNTAITTRIRKGDVEKGFAGSEIEIEDTYETPYQEHMYLEPDAAYAVPEGSGKVTVIGTMQSPFLVREKAAQVLGWTLNQVRVIQALTGGGFGGKDDMGPLVCSKAALAAVHTGRPAALVFDRDETTAFTPKRFPARIRYRSGADINGLVKAAEVDITLECGAYANRAPFWLWRQTAHAAGPYSVPNVSVDGRAVYTNKPFGGSFRGFGNVAMQFATESQMDKMASELGMDPVEFRLRNVLREGSTTTCNQLLDHSVGIEKCLKGVAKASGWNTLRKGVSSGSKVRGAGVACAYHGISTSRSTPDWSASSIIMNEDGTFTYRTGICELGQGAPQGHLRIVSEILGAPLDSIRIEMPDTDSTPDAKPTHGSRGLMLGGTAAADAALKMRERMLQTAGEALGCSAQSIELREGRATDRDQPSRSMSFEQLAKELYVRGVPPASYGFYSSPKRFYDPETGLGVNYSVYTFSATVAEVEVDLETGKVDVKRVWPSMDVGKAVDPMMIEGQIEGAISQGMGFALTEKLELVEGVVLNPNYKDYIIPSSCDTPWIDKPHIVEEPYKHSIFGVKGVGEPAIISVVPAITNAVFNATGLRFNTLPITAERLHTALKGVKR